MRSNFLPELEYAHASDDDWHFGADSEPGLVFIPQEKRHKYLPEGEVQRGVEDTQDCATRDAVNAYETQFTYLFQNQLTSADNRRWLKENGYVSNDRVLFSDAFNAILSGTTRSGNSLKAPIEAIRTNGLIPKKLLPLESSMTWEQYHNPNRITAEMKTLGLEFARRFVLNYEKVAVKDFKEALKTDMLCVAAHAWPQPVNDVYPKCDGPFNHAFLLWLLPAYYAFDNYKDDAKNGEFVKKLATDYEFFPWGYRVYISHQTTDSQRAEDNALAPKVFAALKAIGALWYFPVWWDFFIKRVRGLFRP